MLKPLVNLCRLVPAIQTVCLTYSVLVAIYVLYELRHCNSVIVAFAYPDAPGSAMPTEVICSDCYSHFYYLFLDYSAKVRQIFNICNYLTLIKVNSMTKVEYLQ